MNENSAAFCSHCNTALPPTVLGLTLPDALYQAYLGEKNPDYYLRHFRRFDAEGGTSVSWHWPAFFLTFYWLLYRKMWLAALIYFCLPEGVLLFLGVMGAVLGDAVMTGIGLLYILFCLGMLILPPMFANALYYRHCQAKIRQAQNLTPDVHKQMEILAAKGGTSNIVYLVAILVVIIALIGVVAAIALPAYQDFNLRSHTSNAVTLGKVATVAVSEYYAENRTFPDSLDAVGFAAPNSPSVEAIEIDRDNKTIHVTLAIEAIRGKRLQFLSSVDESGQLSWQCASEEVPAKYLPAFCKP